MATALAVVPLVAPLVSGHFRGARRRQQLAVGAGLTGDGGHLDAHAGQGLRLEACDPHERVIDLFRGIDDDRLGIRYAGQSFPPR